MNYGGITQNHYIYPKNGSFYYIQDGVEVQVPDSELDSVVIADGQERRVTVVNGQMPGPAIHVYEGATVIVHVTNDLINEATSIHWHGLYQRGTPWMDGVPMITQCAILPQTSFTYQFIASPAGTHWYHSHHGLQRPDGLFGPLIIEAAPNKASPTLREKLCDVDDFIMVVNDWYPESSVTELLKRVGPGYYPNGPQQPPTNWTHSVDGKIVGEIPFNSALINGRGRFYDKDHPEGVIPIPFTVYNVEDNKRYCFRAIGANMEKALMISVDGHILTVFASDGSEVDPFQADNLVVHPGETFDFMINADQSEGSGNFWIRAKTMEVEEANSGFAVLHYPRGPNPNVTMPTTTPRKCTSDSPCTILNCPFPAYPQGENKNCVHIDALRNADKNQTVPNYPKPNFDEFFLNFVFEPLGVNRRAFITPSSPLLTQFSNESIVQCNATRCDYNTCSCTHYLTIPYNHTIQYVFTNIGPHGAGMHPVHLHGHNFYVMKMGLPEYDPSTGKVTKNITDDIECVPNTECGVAHWKNGPPQLNFQNPPRKNVVVIPPGGYVVARVVSDNPGWWHMHCHMSHHLEWGMAMVINEAPEKQHLFPAPPNFPQCGNFALDSDSSYYVNKMAKTAELLL
eukprot:CAMPEP_0174251510 /NCGR_PEP_ID=MMETSP0439-20130205/1305_1 /TAXON_ID=0 /ORGANISM="Stereomyxa ramosa, Strain Chinc5" /LENGTH=624 /DNA_ID=CAMNT_0015331841 /DNA_START=93 /DNA_END=1967 /DNA_ORIENTATION=-